MRHPQGQGVQHIATTLMYLLASVLDLFPPKSGTPLVSSPASCRLVLVITVAFPTLMEPFKGKKAT